VFLSGHKSALGLELHVLNASTESNFEAVFAKIGLLRASGLVISAGDPFFVSRRGQLAALGITFPLALLARADEVIE
jgi:putative tryptophan/tyrosine transport system substrate-binding protein